MNEIKEPYNKVKYATKYNKENYTEIKFRVKKGEKENISKHWHNKGFKSLNEYINFLITNDIENGE